MKKEKEKIERVKEEEEEEEERKFPYHYPGFFFPSLIYLDWFFLFSFLPCEKSLLRPWGVHGEGKRRG